MEKEYLILDFGKVIAGPATGEWFFTPKFFEIIKPNKEKLLKLRQAVQKYNYYLGMPMKNEAEEFMCFSEFYRHILQEINYPVTDDLIETMADDWTFNDEKFSFYPSIKEELEYLRDKYKLLILSDNWPSVLRIMHNNDTYKYFEKIYVSSIYGCEKNQGVFFDYPLEDYNLKARKPMFVDDDSRNLMVAEEKGLIPVMMTRENEKVKTKYKTISSLFEL